MFSGSIEDALIDWEHGLERISESRRSNANENTLRDRRSAFGTRLEWRADPRRACRSEWKRVSNFQGVEESVTRPASLARRAKVYSERWQDRVNKREWIDFGQEGWWLLIGRLA